MSDVSFAAGLFDCCCGCSFNCEDHSGFFCGTTFHPVYAEECLVRGLKQMEMYPCKRCLDVQSSSQSQSSSDVVDLSTFTPPVNEALLKSPDTGSKKRKRNENAKDFSTPSVVFDLDHDRAVYSFMKDNVEIIDPIDEFFRLLCDERIGVAKSRSNMLCRNMISLICAAGSILRGKWRY
jgi:hypothetical protein